MPKGGLRPAFFFDGATKADGLRCSAARVSGAPVKRSPGKLMALIPEEAPDLRSLMLSPCSPKGRFLAEKILQTP
jgi:hypothetical protein